MAQNIAVIPKYPEEFNYTLPSGIPSGLRQVQLRQLQYGQIPGAGSSNGTPAGTEIQIILPQLNAAFLDTTSSYINVRATLYGNITKPGGTGDTIGAQNALIQLRGSAWSLFQRYQVYANTTTLTDDINEVGVLAHWLYLLTLDESSRRSSPHYGFSSYDSSGSLNPIGTDAAAEKWLSSTGVYAWGSAATTLSGAYCRLNFVLPVPGTLGSGNDKMYPLFLGPTRISLLTESVTNAFCFSNTNANNIYFTGTSTPTLSFDEVEFVGNYIQCDAGSFDAIRNSIPQSLMVMRTLGFAQSSYNIPATTTSMHEGLISTRRASTKFIMANVFPNDAGLGKFCGVNPYATINTALLVNGVLYPQMTVDPTNKWYDYKNQVECALQVAHTTGNKTCIASDSWMVGCDGTSSTADGGWRNDQRGVDNCWNKYFNTAVSQALKWDFTPQFVFVFDTEHFSKRGFISGVGTLSGSTFFRMQLKYPTPSNLTVNCYNFHDQILVFNLDDRSASIKV